MAIPAPETTIEHVVRQLGLPSTGAQQQCVRVAVTFFTQKMGIDDPRTIASYIEGIDLNWPQGVTKVDLLPGTRLVAYRYDPRRGSRNFDPFGMYFTDVGTAKDVVGIPPENRRFVRYIVTLRVPALKSRAKTGYVSKFGLVYGGAIQYVIPRASLHLRVMHIQNQLP
jgi:hypothetical protein